MRITALLASICVFSVHADVVTDWNILGLNSIQSTGTPPPYASRNLAIAHGAIYDAVVGLSGGYSSLLVGSDATFFGGSQDAAAATAGWAVNRNLYPSQATAIDTLYDNQMAALGASPEIAMGASWGNYVAAQWLANRSVDGASIAATPIDNGGSGPGVWEPTEPGYTTGLLPGWGNVTPFAMTSGSQFRPDGPPSLNSSQWVSEFNEVKRLGAVNSVHRTADQTEIARFWAAGGGTVTPPGMWNQIAQTLGNGNNLVQNARLFAALNVGLADAGISCWDAKYEFDFWRPITAVRNNDGNPLTLSDPNWTPLLTTPPFPEYTSGHSTFSGAASSILAQIMGSDEIAFVVASGDLPGVTRSFLSLSEAANEAGMSRIYGGIHFQSANQDGLEAGRNIGDWVMGNFFQPVPEPTSSFLLLLAAVTGIYRRNRLRLLW
jgi:hypothetical protein